MSLFVDFWRDVKTPWFGVSLYKEFFLPCRQQGNLNVMYVKTHAYLNVTSDVTVELPVKYLFKFK